MAPTTAIEIERPERDPACEEFYKFFAEEAPRRPGIATTDSNFDLKNSELYDPALIAQGREFVRRNYYSVVLSHLIVMMWALASKFIRLLILHNDGGYAEDHAKTRNRYLISIMRIMKWYEGDFENGSTDQQHNISSPKDLEAVRKIHYLVAKHHPSKPAPTLPKLTPRQEAVLQAIRKDTEHIDLSLAPDYVKNMEDPAIPLSQFGMAGAQAFFMGLVALLPEKFGMKDLNGFDGYVHLWAIIGRKLGVEDEFNWALQYKKTKSLDAERELYERYVIPTLKLMDDTAIIMLQDFIDGVSDYVLVARFLPVMKYMFYVCDVQTKNLDALMTWRDRVSYWFIMFNLHFMASCGLTRWFRNRLLKLFLIYGSRKYLPPNYRKYE